MDASYRRSRRWRMVGAVMVVVAGLGMTASVAQASSIETPIINGSADPSQPKIGQPISFLLGVADPATGASIDPGDLTYSWDFDGDGTPDSTSASPSYAGFSTAGDHTVHVTVTDTTGHSFTEAMLVAVHADNRAPRPLAQFTGRPLVGAALPFLVTQVGDDDPAAGASVLWDYGDGATGGNATTHAYASATDRLVTATVTDAGGAAGVVAGMVHPHTDNEPPAINYMSGSGGAGGSASFSVSATDDGTAGSSLTYHWDFGDGMSADTTGIGFTTHTYSDGASYHVAQVTVTDSGSPAASRSAATVIITGSGSGTPPIAIAAPVNQAGFSTLNSGTTTAVVDTSKTLAAMGGRTSAGDACPTDATYEWDFGDGSHGSGGQVSHTWTTTGDKLVALTVTPPSGPVRHAAAVVHVGATSSVAAPVSASQNSAQGTTLLGSSYQPRVGVQYSIPAETLVQAPAGAVSATWDFGDGATGTGLTTQHTWTSVGTKIVKVTATDVNGNSDTEAVAIVVTAGNSAPVVPFTFLSSTLVKVGDAVAPPDYPYVVDPDRPGSLYYSGNGTDGIVSASWDFGDGAMATGLHPSHTYAAAGDYDVRATFTDADGASTTALRTVHVRNDVPQGPASTARLSSYLCGNGSGGGNPPSGGPSFGGGGSGGGGSTTITTPTATSPEPVAPEPIPVPPSVSPSTVPPVAVVQQALSRLLHRSPSYEDLVKDGATTQTFSAPSAGSLRVRWYATIKHKGKTRRVVIAEGVKTFSEPGDGTVSIHIGKRGRKLIKHHKHLKVAVKAMFTPSGGETSVESAKLVIRKPKKHNKHGKAVATARHDSRAASASASRRSVGR